ncbi:phage tail protein [Pedobacter alluvionis]|uniref:Microcystin-dependent protein n=1 Tax=Pedobacter alluvionis TaxID=475253 RepID=A0A497Y6M3_9SPHI|nr:tail fiber protein [Pedobacter alluvionis]RLJ76608.1 microcystin-dependent protein [Pedobacter alluvionis]TFB34112.1 phage tail protein [Pedobacter alluvionis]
MEGTIGEVRMFAGTFVPMNWSACSGQTLAIRAYTTLYAIIGTNYGGDGTNTFKLPDLQGRTIVGTGQGAGLSAYSIGDTNGTESVTIGLPEMSAHIHNLAYIPAAGTATVTVKASADQYDEPSPTGNLLGAPISSGEMLYGVPQAPAQQAPMANGTLSIQSVTGPQLTNMAIAASGSATPAVHENRQPSMALYYVICIQGLFPSRD